MIRRKAMLAPAAILGVAGMAAFAAQQGPSQTQSEGETLTGQVVHLHKYLMKKEQANDRDAKQSDRGQREKDRRAQPQDQDRERARQKENKGPIGLVVADSGLFGPSAEAYVIVFNPNGQNEQAQYEKAKRLIGQRVELTGVVEERSGVRGVDLMKISPAREANADR